MSEKEYILLPGINSPADLKKLKVDELNCAIQSVGYTGDDLKIKEIIAKGPFAVKKTGVTEGCIIEKIDGEKILAGVDYYPMLEGKAGKKVLLSVYNPETKKRFDVTVKAISAGEQSNLLYKRWVRRNEQIVEKLSGGRVAYVHVQGMDSPSFRTVYSELLSEKNRTKDAVIVDTRHNGGGWLHDDLVTLLSGKEYQRFVPRGQYIGSDPFNKWCCAQNLPSGATRGAEQPEPCSQKPSHFPSLLASSKSSLSFHAFRETASTAFLLFVVCCTLQT